MLNKIWIAPLAALCILGWANAAPEPAPNPEPAPPNQERETPPSFKPGAEVTLSIEVTAPDGWVINHQVPVRFTFDDTFLKDGKITVEKPVWDFTIPQYEQRHTFAIPIVLAKKLDDGILSIPIFIECMICDLGGVNCSFANEQFKVRCEVRNKGGLESKNQGLTKGVLPWKVQLSAPY